MEKFSRVTLNQNTAQPPWMQVNYFHICLIKFPHLPDLGEQIGQCLKFATYHAGGGLDASHTLYHLVKHRLEVCSHEPRGIDELEV